MAVAGYGRESRPEHGSTEIRCGYSRTPACGRRVGAILSTSAFSLADAVQHRAKHLSIARGIVNFWILHVIGGRPKVWPAVCALRRPRRGGSTDQRAMPAPTYGAASGAHSPAGCAGRADGRPGLSMARVPSAPRRFPRLPSLRLPWHSPPHGLPTSGISYPSHASLPSDRQTRRPSPLSTGSSELINS